MSDPPQQQDLKEEYWLGDDSPECEIVFTGSESAADNKKEAKVRNLNILIPKKRFKYDIEKNKRLFNEHSLHHDVVEHMYSLDKNDIEFCNSEGINRFQLRRFFTNASRAVHDYFFKPSPPFMVGMDVGTFDKLKEYYERVVKAYKENYGFETSKLVPLVDRIPHMSEDKKKFMIFCPTKQKIPVTKKGLETLQRGYEATFRICQEIHQIHANSAGLVAKQSVDLNFSRKISEDHKRRFIDCIDLSLDDEEGEYHSAGEEDIIMESTNEQRKDESAEDSVIKDSWEKFDEMFPKLRKLGDDIEDFMVEEDIELNPGTDELLEIPNVSDYFVDTVKKQAAVINSFAVLGYSSLLSTQTSIECQIKYPPKTTLAAQRTQRVIKKRRLS